MTVPGPVPAVPSAPDREAEWEVGVGGAQCDECGRTTIVRGNTMNDDPLCESHGWICRRCALGLWDESDDLP